MQKVSIVVPVYNVESYLQQCLESLMNQTYKNLEIILVDDGSQDSSGVICDQYAEKDSRFKVIHQKNAGAANAKNAGLDAATGELLTFLDSDDFVENNWISRMVTELTEQNVDMVECGLDKVYVDGIEKVKEFAGEEGIYSVEEYMAHYLEKWTNSLFWNKLFRRHLTEHIRFRAERRCIDDEFYTYKVIASATRISRISDTLCHYRQRQSSAVRTQKNRLQITDDALEVLIERYIWIKERFPSLTKIYLDHDMDFLLYFDKQGIYDKRLVKKYRKIAWYYLRECIGIAIDKTVFMNAIRLLKNRPKIYAETQENVEIEDGRQYFR